MATIQDPAIPPGSKVLVTGVNGFIGSHVADQFLKLGYQVRGTARDTERSAWIRELFDRDCGEGKFELVAVPDIAATGAFDQAVKGVSAVIHVASNVSFDPDPNKVIPTTVGGALSALMAANSEPTVKRYVLTSSASATMLPKLDTKMIVTNDMWNKESIGIARQDPPYLPERAGHNYAASKALSEREVWKFYYENKARRPDLVVNTVLPSTNFGKSLDVVNQGHPSTSKFVEILWQGTNIQRISVIPPQHFIDVQDVARLHVAAAIHPDVIGERIFAWAEPYNFDTILEILRKQNPGIEFVADFHSGKDLSVVEPRARAEQLLQDLGRQGFTSLEDSIRMNSEGL
ncbi:uncharacterized protein K452DRAFT_290798 [Neofusicoccum parvum]|nr:uncharacterized protein K452DRAFT_290798 [Neofusicoccum parvum]